MPDDPRAWLEERQALAAAATEGRWGFYTPRGRAGRYDPVFGATPGDEVALVKRPNDWRFIADSRTSVPAMAAALTAVLDVHEPVDALMNPGPRERVVKVCKGCGTDDGNWQRHPCPTRRAVEATLGGGS